MIEYILSFFMPQLLRKLEKVWGWLKAAFLILFGIAVLWVLFSYGYSNFQAAELNRKGLAALEGKWNEVRAYEAELEKREGGAKKLEASLGKWENELNKRKIDLSKRENGLTKEEEELRKREFDVTQKEMQFGLAQTTPQFTSDQLPSFIDLIFAPLYPSGFAPTTPKQE